jgi:hypothetical protein
MACMNSVRNIWNRFPDASGWIRGGICDIIPGNGVTIDKSNPEYPIISSNGGGGSGGIPYVSHDNTLTGLGIPASPLSVIGGGSSGDNLWTKTSSSAIAPATGINTVNIGQSTTLYSYGDTWLMSGMYMRKADNHVTIDSIPGVIDDYTKIPTYPGAIPLCQAISGFVSNALSGIGGGGGDSLWAYSGGILQPTTSPTYTLLPSSLAVSGAVGVSENVQVGGDFLVTNPSITKNVFQVDTNNKNVWVCYQDFTISSFSAWCDRMNLSVNNNWFIGGSYGYFQCYSSGSSSFLNMVFNAGINVGIPTNPTNTTFNGDVIIGNTGTNYNLRQCTQNCIL